MIFQVLKLIGFSFLKSSEIASESSKLIINENHYNKESEMLQSLQSIIN